MTDGDYTDNLSQSFCLSWLGFGFGSMEAEAEAEAEAVDDRLKEAEAKENLTTVASLVPGVI